MVSRSLLRLISTIDLVPEGSGNRNCQTRLRKPVFSSIDQLDNKDIKVELGSLWGDEKEERIGGIAKARKGFWMIEALSWEILPGCGSQRPLSPLTSLCWQR